MPALCGLRDSQPVGGLHGGCRPGWGTGSKPGMPHSHWLTLMFESVHIMFCYSCLSLNTLLLETTLISYVVVMS